MTVATVLELSRVVLRPPRSGFRYDQTRKGWEIVEDVPLEGEPTLCLESFLAENENSVPGKVMLERAKLRGDRAGQAHAERLLEYPEDIQSDWRGKYPLFTGTVWRDSDGNLHVPYLYWYSNQWRLPFIWLDSAFLGVNRLVRLCK